MSERADDRADPHRGDQRRVGGGAAVEAEAGQQRQDHLEVEAEGADQGHQRQRHGQLRRAADVAQGGADRASLALGAGGAACSCAGSIRQRARIIAAEGEGVEREAGLDPDGRDQHAGQRRADERAPSGSMTLLRLTALTTRSGPTISIAKLCRVGLSTALTVAAGEDEREDHPGRDRRPAR